MKSRGEFVVRPRTSLRVHVKWLKEGLLSSHLAGETGLSDPGAMSNENLTGIDRANSSRVALATGANRSSRRHKPGPQGTDETARGQTLRAKPPHLVNWRLSDLN